MLSLHLQQSVAIYDEGTCHLLSLKVINIIMSASLAVKNGHDIIICQIWWKAKSLLNIPLTDTIVFQNLHQVCLYIELEYLFCSFVQAVLSESMVITLTSIKNTGLDFDDKWLIVFFI